MDELVTGGEEQAGRDEKAEKKKGGFFTRLKRLLLLILLAMAAVVAGLAATDRLQPAWQQLVAWVNGAAKPQSITPPASEPVVAPAPDASQAVPEAQNPVEEAVPAVGGSEMATPAAGDAVAEPTAEQSTAAQPETDDSAKSPTIAPVEARALLDAMEALRQELKEMAEMQRKLSRTLKAQQRMNLQLRLRWIGDPSSRLSQMAMNWAEIALMPSLSSAERQEAQQMRDLAQSALTRLNSWRAALDTWAERLALPEEKRATPDSERPWLAWLLKQFQLKRAPSVTIRQQQALRDRLLKASQQLALERWPDDGAWQALMAELLLQIRAMESLDARASVETGLPADLHGIRNDIRRLRERARAWAARHGGAS